MFDENNVRVQPKVDGIDYMLKSYPRHGITLSAEPELSLNGS